MAQSKSYENIITLVQISDGAQGPAGPQGPSGEALYRIETNTEEVLQFFNSSGYELTPNIIKITIYDGNGEKLGNDKVTPLITFYNQNELKDFTGCLGYNQETKTWLFNFAILESMQENSSSATSEDLDPSLDYYESFSSFRVQGFVIDITFTKEDQLYSKKLVFRNGLTDEMLKFSVEATNINASINSKKLKFDENGLTITGAGFRIEGIKEGKTVTNLEADDDGNLKLINIISNSGTIGGFSIGNSTLKSADGQSLILNGESGLIEANNIVLGENVTVTDSIKFNYSSNEALYQGTITNPSKKNGVFIQGGQVINNILVPSLEIKTSGDARFGKIHINSNTSTIYANYTDDPDSATAWKLTPKEAVFNNIVANGSIETAVFKKAYTQAVGGTMIFKPCYQIDKINFLKYDEGKGEYLYQIFGQEAIESVAESYVWLNNGTNQFDSGQIEKVLEDGSVLIKTKAELSNLESYKYLLDLGTETDAAIIGINASSVYVGENHILPKGLTMSHYQKGLAIKNPDLFLGDLSSVNSGWTGYGLYSSNVRLIGSLTTVQRNEGMQYYAGVNTLNGKPANFTNTDHGFLDRSPIVFWAGARDENEPWDSNFLVTQNGSVKMQKAYIKDTVFTKGTIIGATIKAAEIRGDGLNGGLSIYDTSGGIAFYGTYIGNDGKKIEKETCRINTEGLSSNNDSVGVNLIRKIDQYWEKTSLTNNGLSFYRGLQETALGELAVITSTGSGVQIKNSSAKFVEFEANKIVFGNNMRYVKRQSDGYDLYID